MAGSDSTKAIFYALGANFSIFVAKAAAAFVTGSGAMLAEAVHSAADCGNQGLLLLGMKRADLPPTPDHPLGYGKATYFWSFLVAVMLFSVGGMFSLYEGWHKLHAPEPLQQWGWAVGVLVFAIVVEGISTAACLREVNKVRGDRSVWRWFRESRQAELVVILGEDLAALFGLIFALIAVVLTVVTGNPIYDAIGTLGIGALLIVVAVLVAIEVKAMLIGQSAEPEFTAEVRRFIEGRPEIAQVYNVITFQLGDDVMLSVKAQVRSEGASADGLVAGINAVEAAVKAKFPSIRWSFFEPDLAD